ELIAAIVTPVGASELIATVVAVVASVIFFAAVPAHTRAGAGGAAIIAGCAGYDVADGRCSRLRGGTFGAASASAGGGDGGGVGGRRDARRGGVDGRVAGSAGRT